MWQLSDYAAALALSRLTAHINVLEPWQGLSQLGWHRKSMPAAVSVLQVDARELMAPNRLPIDVYVRERDLIATFASSEGRNVQTQIYWRARELDCGAPTASIELILSAQTHLLDSRPQLTVTSVLPAGDVLGLAADDRFAELSLSSKLEFTIERQPPVVLFRPLGAAFSYAEMVAPTDFAGASLERRGENLVRISSQLFPERLEKGVIRRARLCGAFFPREGDMRWALAAYHAFQSEPLPLTA